MHINAHLDIDVVAVERDNAVSVMLELTAPESAQLQQRRPQSVVVVLDCSGSMRGKRLEAAQHALLSLTERLADTDSLSVVAFDNEARTIVPPATIARLGRERIRTAIERLDARGGTDLSSGYLRALQSARRLARDSSAAIILLSDGQANNGITDPGQLRDMAAKAAAQGISTSTIGIGLGYDDEILSEMAVGGTGNHTFAEHADSAGAAIMAEVDGLLSKTVQAASLRIVASEACAAVRVLNDLPTLAGPDDVTIELGDFYGGETRRLVLELSVPAMPALGLAQVAELEMSYVSVTDLRAHTISAPISVNVVPADVAAGRVPDPQVRRTALLLRTQEAKKRSGHAMREWDIEGAKRILTDSLLMLGEIEDDPEVSDEIDFLSQTLHDLDERGTHFTGKSLTSDRVKKSRGYATRQQGGTRDASKVCERCGTALVPVVYGMPGPEMSDRADRGEIILGGCNIRPGQKSMDCPNCRGDVRDFFGVLDY